MIVVFQKGIFRIISDGNQNIKQYETKAQAEQVIDKKKNNTSFSVESKWYIIPYSEIKQILT